MTNSETGARQALVVPPLELRANTLTITEAPDAGGAVRAHELDDCAARVMAVFMRAPGTFIARRELLAACPGGGPSPRQLTATCLGPLGALLPRGHAVHAEIIGEPHGYRLCVDTRADRLGVGPLELAPTAAWCWVDGERIALRRGLVTLLATLMSAPDGFATDDALRSAGKLTDYALRCRVHALRPVLADASGKRIDVRLDGRGFRRAIGVDASLLAFLMARCVDERQPIDTLVAAGFGARTSVERRLRMVDEALRRASGGGVHIAIGEHDCRLIVGGPHSQRERRQPSYRSTS